MNPKNLFVNLQIAIRFAGEELKAPFTRDDIKNHPKVKEFNIDFQVNNTARRYWYDIISINHSGISKYGMDKGCIIWDRHIDSDGKETFSLKELETLF